MGFDLSNLRTGSKLILTFGMIIVGFAGLLLMAQFSLQEIQAKQQDLFDGAVARELDLRELRNGLDAVRADLLALTLSADPQQRADLEAGIQQRVTQDEELFRRLMAQAQGESEAASLLRELHGLWQAFNQTRERNIFPLLRAGQVDQARLLILGIQAERVVKIRELGQRLTAQMQTQTSEQLRDSEALLTRQSGLFLGVGGLLVGLTVLFAWALTRDLARPLGQLTAWAERISRGEIPRELGFSRRLDEVGLLGQAFTRMGEYLLALAEKAEALARGELPENAPLSEHDVLGQAFARTGQYFQTLAGKAERLARGELQGELQPASERDVLGRAFAAMIGNLRNLVQELHESISMLASASEEILAVTTQVASSTQETATAISEIATTVEEVKQAAVLSGSQSQAVSESTERTRQVAQSGLQAVEQNLQGMGQIREQMQAVAESIMRLGEQSQTIGEIVASVNDLAEQSNLLGVNASIEAVKAGEAGKGFSVVAQEVKTLAEQSKQATAQVRGILGDIQKAMTRAVMLAEEGSKSVEGGYQRAQSSGEAIRTLGNSVEESSEVAMQIAASSQQQMVGMEQIGGAMESIRQASQDNVAGARQVDLAARNLHELGVKLKGLAAQFKL
ncbi:HAMP domain-containing methyl-accepting chemotaxis protein [Pseudomonas sp. CAU 1711]|uniref:methyl-accepting chemotaxis protein n=1 Tax=Pseudomonas sp. CAU 1711 TaxID=3140356 RepID=UPI003260459A